MKRQVQVTLEPDRDAAAVESPAPARDPAGRFSRDAEALSNRSQPSTREWVNDDSGFDGPRSEMEAVLAASDAAPTAATSDNTDADANPPAETPGTQPPAAAPPAPAAAATADVTPTYLSAEQRADLGRKLAEGRREREREAEIKRINEEYEATKRKMAGSLDDRLSLIGKSREELLEDLMLGRGTEQEAAKPLDPTVAALKAELDALKAERVQERNAIQQQATKQQRQFAVQRLQTAITKGSGYVMIDALKAHGHLMDRCEELFDGTSDIWQVTGIAADELESKLRQQYPDVAAVLTAQGGAAPAADAPPPAAERPKPSVGSRGRAAPTDNTDDLPTEHGERHQATKDRFFPNWRR